MDPRISNFLSSRRLFASFRINILAKVNGVYLCDGITLFETCDSNSEWPSEGLKERVRTLVTFVTMPQWRGGDV